jgi:protease I
MPTPNTIAILVDDLYEELELWYPYHRLREAGFEPLIVGPEETTYKGKSGGYLAEADIAAAAVKPTDLAGVIVPGGYAPDRMRRHPEMIDLVRKMNSDGKLVAAICHAGWLLISAGVVEGRRVTSFFSIRDDMENAGAKWEDSAVVVDGNLVTSRQPGDLPNFMKAILKQLS